MKRYRQQVFLLDIFFVLLIVAIVIMYGHLIGLYTSHTLFIIFIFIIIITSSIYVYDVVRQMLHRRIRGLRVMIQETNKEIYFPKTITINEIRKKNYQHVYRYQGFNIPVCFVEHVDQERAYLYPFYKEKVSTDNLYEIVENYRYEFFLIKDNLQQKYIVNREQVLSIE